jgi:PAS domain S-box-containing protein
MAQVLPEQTKQPAEKSAPPNTPDLRSMLSTAELGRRPSRAPDYEAESKALIALAQSMAASPEAILQKLADTALSLCQAHSAGLSLLEEADQKSNFHWRAIAGQWAPHKNGGTPRNFGPCGAVLDQDVAMICSHPELDFPYWEPIRPILEEGLLVPFYIKGEAVGTIWVVAHDTSRRFDAEDLRVMTSLAMFAAAAYQTLLALEACEKIASIVESSDDAIVGKDLNGVITSWNTGAERLFGYTSDEVVGKLVTILIPPDRHDEERTILERIKRGVRIDHYETVRLRKDGSSVSVSLTVSPVKNAEGKIVGASKIARDITERKRVEAREKVLMAELDHRVKNVLARVAMVVKSSRSGSSSIDEYARSLDGRIRALGAAHALLSQGGWRSVGLDAVIRSQLAPCATGANITICGTDVMLTTVATQVVAMVLHELVTNAAKYGALSVPNGRVSVNWECRSDGDAATNLVFVWREFGGPPTASGIQSGYGTRLIRELVPYELGGKVDLVSATEGVSCRIEFPLEQV